MKTFEDFFSVPVWFYRRLGNSAEPFGSPFDRPWKQVFFRRIFFTFLFIYFWAMVLTGKTVIGSCINGSILEILASSCCFFFCVNGLLKEGFFYNKLKNMYTLANDLKDIFPNTPELQRQMNVNGYCKKISKFSVSFAAFANGFILLWNVMPIFNSTKDFLIYGGKFRRDLCYYISYPWDHQNGPFGLYLFSYFIDVIAGIFAGVTFANIDLIQSAIITLISMYLDYISKSMEEYVPTGNLRQDYDFIYPFIRLHNKCLR